MSDLKKYNIVPRADISADQWDKFVAACDQSWLWHTSDFLDIFQSWRNQDDHSFAVLDNRKSIVAVVPLAYHPHKRRKIFRCDFLTSLGGVAIRDDFSSKRKKEVYTVVEDHFNENAYHIDITIPPLTPFLFGGDVGRINPLVLCGYDNMLTQSCVIDLSQSIDDTQKAMSQTTRQQFKKMDDVDIAHATVDDLDLYYEMHCETYNRTGVKPHPYEYFEGIFTRMMDKGYARITKLSHNGTVVAMKNCARYKGGVLYWTGASRNDIDSGFNRLLMIEQIKQAKADGFRSFETGEVFPGTKDKKKAGLTLYKSSFGGEYYPFYKGRKKLK